MSAEAWQSSPAVVLTPLLGRSPYQSGFMDCNGAAVTAVIGEITLDGGINIHAALQQLPVN